MILRSLTVAIVAALSAAAPAWTRPGPPTQTEPNAPYQVGAVEVVEPWIRTPPSTAPTAAAYLTIVNRGRIADRLVSASSLLARAIQIHEMSMAGGMMRMRELSGGVAIGPGQTRQLAPAGEHLMMVNPTRAFHSGEKVPITLTFARAGRVTAEFEVRDAPPSVRLGSAGVKMR